MRALSKASLFAALVVATTCAHRPTVSEIEAPRAAIRPHALERHGHRRTDHYFWLSQRENPEVIEYLNAENSYLDEVLRPTLGLQDELFSEMKSRMKEDEDSSPVLENGYFYLSRMKKGRQYPIYLRRKGSSAAADEILLDVNRLAEGREFTNCTFPQVSDDSLRMMYACDFQGRNFFTWRGRDLGSGKDFSVTVENVTPDGVWAADHRNFFYVKQDPETLRSDQVWRINVETGDNALVYEERDETFSVSLSASPAAKFIAVNLTSTMTTEVRLIDRAKPLSKPVVFAARERGHEYSVIDAGDRFYVVTNWKAKNFRVMEAFSGRTTKNAWKEVVAHRSDALITGFLALRDWLAIEQKRNGLNEITVLNRQTGKKTAIPFQDQSYLAGLASNREFDAQTLRYQYESMRQPEVVFDFNPKTGKSTRVWAKQIPGFDASKYHSERIWITARDGTKLPVSLVMLKSVRKDASQPLLVYGYGSYGASMEAWFQSSALSLVDRGWVYAMTHIRGGSELGRAHYENGRQMKKKNTFTDFIDTTEALIKLGYADPKRVYAEGGSAGGLLMGAVMNMRPDLYRGIIAEVPFVDVVTTMLDDSIPLTTSEYDEWGNPNEKPAYEYMLSYSPYDNVARVDYPHLLVTTGLHDSQVQYWEPAKWVAKLRELKTDRNLTLLKTNMTAGHGGASGRYERLKEHALNQAFLLFVDGR